MARISWEEYQRIRNLKELDLQQCYYCHKITILNLGWKPFGKYYCQKHEKEYFLCWELCYKVCVNILNCELVRERKQVPPEPVKPNQPYDKCVCYSCGKELRGAGKTGKIKNRNDPKFWGIKSEFKIMCLGCIGKRFYRRMVDWQRKKFREYVRRGYV